jgi:hypothetical protein
LLTEAWLRALESFQQRALTAAEQADPLEAAVAMAGSQIGFARERPEDARLLLTLRRDDLLDAHPGEQLRARLDAINAPLSAKLRELTKALCGKADARALELVTRAVVDLPNAAVHRHLREGRRPPAWLQSDVTTAARRLLEVGR